MMGNRDSSIRALAKQLGKDFNLIFVTFSK